LQENYSISIFIKDDITDDKLKELELYLKSREYTSRLEYISKE
jgi:cell division protein FtsX